nr:DUF1467 family protein [Anaplasma centrale]
MFTITWWVAIFIALPINIEVDANPQVGCAGSAPRNAHLAAKVLIVTIISSMCAGLYCYLKYVGYLADLSFLYDLVP